MSTKTKAATHVVTAQNVIDGTIDITVLDVTGPNMAIVQVRRAGAIVAWDGAVTYGDAVVTVDNAGAVDWVADDVINVVASAG